LKILRILVSKIWEKFLSIIPRTTIGTVSNSYTKNLITFSSSFLDSLQDDVKKRRYFVKVSHIFQHFDGLP